MDVAPVTEAPHKHLLCFEYRVAIRFITCPNFCTRTTRRSKELEITEVLRPELNWKFTVRFLLYPSELGSKPQRGSLEQSTAPSALVSAVCKGCKNNPAHSSMHRGARTLGKLAGPAKNIYQVPNIPKQPGDQACHQRKPSIPKGETGGLTQVGGETPSTDGRKSSLLVTPPIDITMSLTVTPYYIVSHTQLHSLPES